MKRTDQLPDRKLVGRVCCRWFIPGRERIQMWIFSLNDDSMILEEVYRRSLYRYRSPRLEGRVALLKEWSSDADK